MNPLDRYIFARTTVLAAIAAGGTLAMDFMARAGNTVYRVPSDCALAIYRLDGGRTAATANAVFLRLDIRQPGDTVARYTIEQAALAESLQPPIMVPPDHEVRAFLVNGSAAAAGLGVTCSLLAVIVPLPVYEKWSESLPPFVPSIAGYGI